MPTDASSQIKKEPKKKSMIAKTTKMKYGDFAGLKHCIKTNDRAIMDKPYRRKRKKIVPCVSPYILYTEIKNNKQYY